MEMKQVKMIQFNVNKPEKGKPIQGNISGDKKK